MYRLNRDRLIKVLHDSHETAYTDGYPDRFFLSRERAEYLADLIIQSDAFRSDEDVR
jgi:hypothetical protein